MSLIYSLPYKVPFFQSDAARRMTVPAILGVALQVSGEQSIALGRSDVWIAQHYNLAWIVTEYALDITRFPAFSENILIETEAKTYNKLFCYRDFRFLSADKNEVLLTIHSTWVLMDITSRKVSRIIEDIPDPYEATFVKKIVRGHKFLPSLEQSVSQTYQVRFSDIDINQHVNNTKYYDWAIELLDFDFLVSHEPRQVYIKYNREVRPGAEIRSSMVRDGLTTHHQINAADCEIEIHWAATTGRQK